MIEITYILLCIFGRNFTIILFSSQKKRTFVRQKLLQLMTMKWIKQILYNCKISKNNEH